MIAYNPKDWFTFIFKLHKADTFRMLIPLMITMGLYSTLVAYLEMNVFKLDDKSVFKNFTNLHTLLGFVLSMLLVFRTNTAYDRWWEGRKLWGSLVNSSRNLAIKLNAILDHSNISDREFFSKSIGFYATILSKWLAKESTRLLLDELESEKKEKEIGFIHHPNYVQSVIVSKLFQLNKEGKISATEMLLINKEIENFADVCGACERIKNTPIPFSYSSFIKKFIFFYIMTLPFGYVFALKYWVIPFTMFVFYVLVSLELIAEEIEDPFNFDTNDIPTDKISENINKNVKEILER